MPSLSASLSTLIAGELPQRMDENRRKHLEMIQAIISRLAGNSFVIRGWSITLVSALLAIALKEWQWSLLIACYFPNLLFWLLDSTYLLNERKFRWLFNQVQDGKAGPFEMNLAGAEKEPANRFRAVWRSPTMLCFHLAIVLLITFFILLVVLIPHATV